MRKPEGWDEAQAVIPGEHRRLPAGGYVCTIVGTSVSRSKGGNEMLVLLMDISEGEHEGHFMRDYSERQAKNANASWPPSGTYWQNMEGNGTRFAKGLLELISKENGFQWDFDERELIGKKIGVLFREEEYLGNDGKVRASVKPYSFRSLKAIREGNYKVPEKKALEDGADVFGGTKVADKEIPF